MECGFGWSVYHVLLYNLMYGWLIG